MPTTQKTFETHKPTHTTARRLYNAAYRALRVRGELYRTCTGESWRFATGVAEWTEKNRPEIYNAARASYTDRLEHGLRDYAPFYPRFIERMTPAAQRAVMGLPEPEPTNDSFCGF